MSTELLVTTLVLIGLATMRLGLPLLLLWLLGRALRYMQTALP